MTRKLRTYVALAAVALLSVGCGGGSSGGAGFTNNLSGIWNGAITPTGVAPVPTTVTINQPVAGSVASVRNAAVGLTGTVSVPGGNFPMTGTKDGNKVFMQFTNGAAVGTLDGALTTANNMGGNYSDTTGVTGTWQISRAPAAGP